VYKPIGKTSGRRAGIVCRRIKIPRIRTLWIGLVAIIASVAAISSNIDSIVKAYRNIFLLNEINVDSVVSLSQTKKDLATQLRGYDGTNIIYKQITEGAISSISSV
jgi:hypothetical protein